MCNALQFVAISFLSYASIQSITALVPITDTNADTDRYTNTIDVRSAYAVAQIDARLVLVIYRINEGAKCTETSVLQKLSGKR